MRIALDFDGVLSHTMKRWVDVFNNEYISGTDNNELTLRDISEWGFYEKLGMEGDEAFDVFDQCWQNWNKLEPMEHDLEQKTKMLFNLANGELDVVTSVNEDFMPQIKEWLANQKCVYRNLIHSKDKHELDYDIYIDDSPQNAVEIFLADKVVLMMNQPWNRNVDNYYKEIIENSVDKSAYLTRVYNLYHAIDTIRNLVKMGRF